MILLKYKIIIEIKNEVNVEVIIFILRWVTSGIFFLASLIFYLKWEEDKINKYLENIENYEA